MNVAEFTKYLFERPTNNPEWYFHPEHEDLDVAKDVLVRLAGKVFTDIVNASDQFSEAQVCMGLQYLVNPSCGPIPYLYVDASIDISVRAEAISSMKIVFRDLFARQISEPVLYRTSSGSPLSYRETCYMWWDMFPRHGVPRQANMEDTDAVICRTIASILEIDNLACQEAALHGLGHWFPSRPAEVGEVVSSFLPHAPIELKQYALDAVQGRIQ